MRGVRRTPLYDSHVELGARFVEFAGFRMPVQYSSILREHAAVREAAGLFDVSHMGQIELRGPAAVASAEGLLSRRVATLREGRARYALLCNERGGVVDDVTCYRTAPDALFLCVNAACVEKDWRWVVRHAAPEAGPAQVSERTGMLALQGPASAEILTRLVGAGVADLGRFAFGHFELAGAPVMVSRTGYTGLDGFEIYLGAGHLVRIFEAILAEGEPLGAVPAGLGARDTLRLEAALPLYGHELDDLTTPLEAGLERFVDLDDRDFIGAEALRQQRSQGVSRRLVGLVLEGRSAAREGDAVRMEGEEVGRVTSGAPSPTLGKPVALAYVPADRAEPGRGVEVVVRGRAIPARQVETPFVRRAGS